MAESREAQISSKEAAIKRKLAKTNNAAKSKALKSINSKIGGTKKYSVSTIKGAKDGFTKSDYGVGKGAAIPYQIGSGKKTVSKSKPKPKSKSSGGHTKYKVKRGDTLSGIAKRHGTSVNKIWNYNLKNRSKKTQRILRKRGKNLIYRGGMFYIPK